MNTRKKTSRFMACLIHHQPSCVQLIRDYDKSLMCKPNDQARLRPACRRTSSPFDGDPLKDLTAALRVVFVMKDRVFLQQRLRVAIPVYAGVQP
jgi:hypothetical protein